MTDLDTRLDQAIDALNREVSPATHENNDPDLTDLVDAARIVKSLREPAEPDATFVSSSIERLSQELAPATVGNGIPPASQPVIRVSPVEGMGRSGRLRSWLREMSELAAVLLVILIALTGIVLYQTVFSGGDGQDAAISGTVPAAESDGPMLMISEQSGEALPRGLQIQPIDPISLGPVAGTEAFDFGHHYTYTFSPDGEILAAIIWPSGSSNGGGVLHFFDLDSWTDTATDITFDNHISSLVYNSAGTDLFWASPTQHDPAHGMPRDYELYRYDIAQNTVTTILGFPESFSPKEMKLLDSDSRMAVYGNPINADTNLSEGPPRIMIVDLASGAVDADVELTGVIAAQHREENEQGETEYVIYTPGLAWDVGRNRLYIVHADEDVITIVDLELGAMTTQQEIKPQESLLDSFMSWLVPDAAAKGGEYVQRSAWLSEDGSQLYATGNGFQLIDTVTMTKVRRLDVNISQYFTVANDDRLLLHTYSGTIETENLGTATTGNRLVLLNPTNLDEIAGLDIGHPFRLQGVSPDGRFAFISYQEHPGEQSGFTVSVIDLETMEVTAQRLFKDAYYIAFIGQ